MKAWELKNFILGLLDELLNFFENFEFWKSKFFSKFFLKKFSLFKTWKFLYAKFSIFYKKKLNFQIFHTEIFLTFQIIYALKFSNHLYATYCRHFPYSSTEIPHGIFFSPHIHLKIQINLKTCLFPLRVHHLLLPPLLKPWFHVYWNFFHKCPEINFKNTLATGKKVFFFVKE